MSMERTLEKMCENARVKYVMTGEESMPHAEHTRILNAGLQSHVTVMQRYLPDTPQHQKAKKLFMGLFEYMDLHNDFIDEKYRKLYREVIQEKGSS